MNKHNQVGAVNVLLIPFVLAILLLITAASFGGWAFSSRQDYKNNVDQKIATAVTVAKQQESTLKDNQFAETEKQPLKTYNGPQAYGTLVVNYPKTWSAYVDDTGNGNAQVDGYFNPGAVPSISDQKSSFALRVQVLSSSYSDTLQTFTSSQQTGAVTVAPYKLPKVPSVVGVMVTGRIASNVSGSMVILPLRSNTLEIYTEGSQFQSDFTNNILPNFSFSP